MKDIHWSYPFCLLGVTGYRSGLTVVLRRVCLIVTFSLHLKYFVLFDRDTMAVSIRWT